MINKRIFGVSEAMISLRPNLNWELVGTEYSGLVWLEKEIDPPTKSEIESEIKKLQSEYDALEYQRLREKEYPDFKEYLDGIVKGNQEQVDSYIAKCLAVKKKYPKPDLQA
jgi:hypothetical protein